MSKLQKTVALATLATVFSLAARAQLTTATFYTIVTDPTGAAVPGATVTLVHGGTATAVTKMTDSNGEAAFDFLRIGEYTLTIEGRGFKRYHGTGIELPTPIMRS
jgi:hypothetical protein